MQQSSPLFANGTPVLPDAELRRLARFIANELEALHGLEPALLTAAEVAKQYGLSRGWVYRHARELGGQRMGTGPKARLRFRARDVQVRLSELQLGERQTGRSGSPTTQKPAGLLPIGPKRGGRGRPRAATDVANVAAPTGRPTLAARSRLS